MELQTTEELGKAARMFADLVGTTARNIGWGYALTPAHIDGLQKKLGEVCGKMLELEKIVKG
jgi:hypothetical protein